MAKTTGKVWESGNPAWADTPLGRHAPPPPEMATAEDGTHPTGKPSCVHKGIIVGVRL